MRSPRIGSISRSCENSNRDEPSGRLSSRTSQASMRRRMIRRSSPSAGPDGSTTIWPRKPPGEISFSSIHSRNIRSEVFGMPASAISRTLSR